MVALATLLVGCGQTTGSLDKGPRVASAGQQAPRQDGGAPARGQRAAAVPGQRNACVEAAQKAANAQTGAAIASGALSMVGGLGGFAGQGGMVAAHAATIGTTAIQAQAQADAQAAMAQEC